MKKKIEILNVFTSVGPHEAYALLGHIPSFIHTDDTRDIVTQLNDRYSHGGGWNDMPVGPGGWQRKDDTSWILTYPGDPDIEPIGFCVVRDERVLFYRHSIVVVAQRDGSFRIARLD